MITVTTMVTITTEIGNRQQKLAAALKPVFPSLVKSDSMILTTD
jgi:hypothetical protein